MTVKLSDHFTFKRIARITIAPILMMVFTSLYTIVDGIFVSNFAGEDAFAGLNLIYPIIMIIGGVGFMFGTGGTALVSKLLGEKRNEDANRIFSLVIYTTLAIGVAISVGGFFLIRPFAEAMGRISEQSSEKMVEQAIIYGRILVSGQFLFMIQNVFQSFFACAERPGTGFLFTFSSGITNMVFDALLVGVLPLGIVGAAIATVGAYAVGAIGPFLFFVLKKDLMIRLGKTSFQIKPLLRTMSNGISEFITNISSCVVGIAYNAQLLRYFGQNGVSAYGIVLYVNFVFISTFIGYCIGMAPVIGYHYGAQNKAELQNILKKSLLIIGGAGLVMFGLAIALSTPLSLLFSSANPELAALAEKGERIYALTYLICGYSIFFSSFFTALNNGLVSGLISLLRTLLFQVAFVLLLPLWVGGDGIWWSGLIAETASLVLGLTFLFALSKRYGYLSSKPAA